MFQIGGVNDNRPLRLDPISIGLSRMVQAERSNGEFAEFNGLWVDFFELFLGSQRFKADGKIRVGHLDPECFFQSAF